MNIVFAGSGAFGIPALEALVREGLAPRLVLSQPDRPMGRRRQLTPQPLAAAAEKLGLETFKPDRINTIAARARLSEVEPDLMIVVAYGQILKPKVLGLPRLGCINIHGSALPRHRGASPIQASLLAGDATSGVTIIQMDEGLDTGDILALEETPIAAGETAGVLHDRLAALGGTMIADTVRGLDAGTVHPTPQDHERATTCGLIAKADGRIDWARPAADLVCLVRGMTPWPGAQTTILVNGKDERLTLLAVEALEGEGSPGAVLEASGERLVIATGDGALLVRELQRAGKKPLDAASFLRGTPVAVGDRWGSEVVS